MDQPTSTPETMDQSTSAPETMDQSTSTPQLMDQSTSAPETMDQSTSTPETMDQTTSTPKTMDQSVSIPETMGLPTSASETTDNTSASISKLKEIAEKRQKPRSLMSLTFPGFPNDFSFWALPTKASYWALLKNASGWALSQKTSGRRLRKKVKGRAPPPVSAAKMKDVELPEHIWWLPNGRFKCVVCYGESYYLSSLRGVKTHCESRRHRTEAAKAQVKEEVKLRIKSSGTYDPVYRAHSLKVTLSEKMTRMVFTISNVSKNSHFRFVKWNGPYMNGELKFPQPPPAMAEYLLMKPGQILDLAMEIEPKLVTTLNFKVYFHLEDVNRILPKLEYEDEKLPGPKDMDGKQRELGDLASKQPGIENVEKPGSVDKDDGKKKQPRQDVDEKLPGRPHGERYMPVVEVCHVRISIVDDGSST